MNRSRVTTLQRTELFGCLTAEELADIAERAAELHFKRGEMLFLSGERAKGLFVVVSGRIRVFQQNAEGREQVMHIDSAGSIVAEVAVFDGGPYPASAMSEVDVDVLFIDKHDMHDFCRKSPGFSAPGPEIDGAASEEARATGGKFVLPGSRTKTRAFPAVQSAIRWRAYAGSSCIPPPFIPP